MPTGLKLKFILVSNINSNFSFKLKLKFKFNFKRKFKFSFKFNIKLKLRFKDGFHRKSYGKGKLFRLIFKQTFYSININSKSSGKVKSVLTDKTKFITQNKKISSSFCSTKHKDTIPEKIGFREIKGIILN